MNLKKQIKESVLEETIKMTGEEIDDIKSFLIETISSKDISEEAKEELKKLNPELWEQIKNK